MPKRKILTVTVTLSVDARMSVRDAKREVRTRINELVEWGASLDGYYDYAEQSSVRASNVKVVR